MSSRITVIRGAGAHPAAVFALRERQAPSSADERPGGRDAGEDGPDAHGDDNPFAPPAKGAPDQPWRPRRPSPGEAAGQDGPEGERPGGERWSSRQPAPHHGPPRDQGPFGPAPGGPVTPPGHGPERPPDGQRPQGQGGGQGGGPRFDFTDPVQRRARYSLLAGMWALFFGLFGLPQVALLLGALALYWGISALRGTAKRPEDPAPDRPDPLGAWRGPGATSGTGPDGHGGRSGPVAGPPPHPPAPHRPQFTAAVCGTIAAGLALLIVVATFSFQIAYKDYYGCVNDALTQPARHSCTRLLPQVLRHGFADQD